MAQDIIRFVGKSCVKTKLTEGELASFRLVNLTASAYITLYVV